MTELLTNEDSPDLDELGIDSLDEGDLNVDARQASIALAKNDRSLAEFHRWYTRGRIIVDPEWQRKYVWDRKRASRLIESFLIDSPYAGSGRGIS